MLLDKKSDFDLYSGLFVQEEIDHLLLLGYIHLLRYISPIISCPLKVVYSLGFQPAFR